MKEIINNPYYSSLIVLITQIVFLYFRTLNVMYVAEGKILPSVITGNMIGISWLISIAVGSNAIMNLQWQPILCHIVGGTIGTLWGFKTKKKLK